MAESGYSVLGFFPGSPYDTPIYQDGRDRRRADRRLRGPAVVDVARRDRVLQAGGRSAAAASGLGGQAAAAQGLRRARVDFAEAGLARVQVQGPELSDSLHSARGQRRSGM